MVQVEEKLFQKIKLIIRVEMRGALPIEGRSATRVAVTSSAIPQT